MLCAYLCYANMLKYTMLKTMLWRHQPPISHNKFYIFVVNNICDFLLDNVAPSLMFYAARIHVVQQLD